MQIKEIMAADVKICSASASVTAAAQRMREEDIGDVVVLDDEGGLTGILTDRDIVVRVIAEERDPHSVSVGSACSSDVVTLSPEQDVEEAASIMRQHGVRRLPVVSDGEPVGMVSLGDLAIQRDSDSALADISAHPGNR